MPRGEIGRARPDRETIDVEIARLRELDVGALRARWHTVFGRRPPPHLPRHLCFAFWLTGSRRTFWVTSTLKASACLIARKPLRRAGQRAVARRHARPGTVLGREWNGQMQRVTVLENGFAWKGKIYPSLSKIALAIIANRYRNAPTKRTHVYKFKSIRDARTAIRDTFVERREASSKQGIIDRLTKWPKAV
jgi:hypothetical protein